MAESNSFEVIIRRKVPYLTTFLLYMWLIFTVAFFVLSAVFLPAHNQSSEMKTVYFMLAVPKFIQTALFISGVGFLLFLFLHEKARLYKSAMLTFSDEGIRIVGPKIDLNIPINSITKAFCMDSKDLNGVLKEKFTVYFEQADKKETRVRLKDYAKVDNFMSKLMTYDSIEFKFYDFDVSPGDEQ